MNFVTTPSDLPGLLGPLSFPRIATMESLGRNGEVQDSLMPAFAGEDSSMLSQAAFTARVPANSSLGSQFKGPISGTIRRYENIFDG